MKNFFLVCLLVLGVLPIAFGIFHPGFFLTDDGNWMVIRLSAFYETLRQGQFPVRFLLRLNNGFGYPVADFLYPLFLYLGSFIHIFHLNFVTTIKILFALSIIGSLTGTFFWLKNKFNETSAFVGALIYTLFPYHIWDITKRGSLGEVLAMGILPFVLWSIDRQKIPLTAFFVGLLILSHNTLAILFLPIIIVYMILESKTQKGALSILLGLGFAAFFWIPSLFDAQYTVFGKTVVSKYSQYFLSPNMYSLAGLIFLLIILFSLINLFRNRSKELIFFLIISVVSIFLSLSISDSVWQFFNFSKYIQFPFRFLSVTALGMGYLAGDIIKGKKYRVILTGVVLIFLYISSFQFFFSKTYQYYPDTYYSTNQDTTTVQNEYMPIWVKKMPIKFQQNNMDLSSQIVYPKVYFPGWVVLIDSKRVKITPSSPYGFISYPALNGKRNIKIYFGETPIRFFADLLSLISLLIIIFSLHKENKLLRFVNKHLDEI